MTSTGVLSRRSAPVRKWLQKSVSRHRWLTALIVIAVLAIAGLVLANTGQPGVRVSSAKVAVTPEGPGEPVADDTSLYLPDHTPAPAILLAHGFGGTKADTDKQARNLAEHGYVVMTFTARGFGASGGLIHLDSLDYEVADASRLLDWLQQRPEVLTRNGTPVIGVAGASYGGALALMLGATDKRISTVAADITWNDLAQALFPNKASAVTNPGSTNAAGAINTIGVFKKLWAGYLFADGFNGTPFGPLANPQCGRFSPSVCALYQQASAGGVLSPDFAALLGRSSPATVLNSMTAPTLLSQGEQDSLFDLDQADANARQVAAAGAPVTVRWRSGGHDAAGTSDNITTVQRSFFDAELRGKATVVRSGFALDQRDSAISSTTGERVTTTLRASAGYPSIAGNPAAPRSSFALTGASQVISAPAGGVPAAVSVIPGLGSALGTASAIGLTGSFAASELPGQTAAFVSAPLQQSLLISGSSTVRLRFSAKTDVTAFVSIHDLGPSGSDTLPAQLVSPIHLAASGQAITVDVRLPSVVARVPAGHRLAVVVSTTDFGYQLPTDARTYTVSLVAGSAAVSVPSVNAHRTGSSGTTPWLIAAAIAVLLSGCTLGWRRFATRSGDHDGSLAEVPVVVTDLVKEYGDGYRAVDGVSFRVERGQVLGLLGPNGAGKTTTLRVLMGLILPTQGSIRVFGDEVVPGAPALARLGAFVEGPGLLPHLSGAENLRLFWAASGRPTAAAEMATVLQIAGLGSSLQRRVKTYSHGMQQRLAIAQAMLGLPEVLVLDEPTNGLDPPQIAEMRHVLHRYAATGRTVIVSSHLLAEVEQTCTHVVVMHRGRLVAAGSVDEVAGQQHVQLAVADPDRARQVLAAAGIAAEPVPAKRALEDVFLDLIGERRD